MKLKVKVNIRIPVGNPEEEIKDTVIFKGDTYTVIHIAPCAGGYYALIKGMESNTRIIKGIQYFLPIEVIKFAFKEI